MARTFTVNDISFVCLLLLSVPYGLRYSTLSRPLNTLTKIHFVSLLLFKFSNLIMVYGR